MKIGFFDSGIWWYYHALICHCQLPNYDCLFYGDNIHLPFGDKTAKQIQHYTFNWIKWLFNNHCELVILACNTASAYSVETWQKKYPTQKILSVTLSLLEILVQKKFQKPLILCTKATKKSGFIERTLKNLNYKWNYRLVACNWLADSIEKSCKQHNPFDITYSTKQQRWIWSKFIPPDNDFDCIVLACTHYSIRSDSVQLLYPHIPILDTAKILPSALKTYLFDNNEMSKNPTTNSNFTTYRTKKVKISKN